MLVVPRQEVKALHDERREEVAAALAAVLVAVTALRVVAAVVAGSLVATEDANGFGASAEHLGQTLTAFGSGGGTFGAILVVAAAACAARSRRRAPWLAPAVAVMVGLVALSIVVAVTGEVVTLSQFPAAPAAAQVTQVIGFGAADLLLCVGGAAAARRLAGLGQEASDEEPEPVLFAIDRADGEAFAFFSRAEAVRTLSVYSIEDGELDFYDDEGMVVTARVENERVQFVTTDVGRRDELLTRLRRFADRERVRVAEDDDPLSFARPIADWQWLQLWPGWLRPIGRLIRAWSGGARGAVSAALDAQP